MHAVDAIMYLMYFVVVMQVLQLLAKHSSAVLLRKRFINKRDLSVHYSYTIPHPNCYVSFATINLFLLFNTSAKMNHIDPLRYISMN